MPIEPESLEAGRCYVTEVGQVQRIVQIMPDGRVQFENRRPLPKSRSGKSEFPIMLLRRDA